MEAEGVSLLEARQWLRDRIEDGARCPCCTQYAKVYRRRMTSTTVRTMIAIHHHYGRDEFVHIPSVMKLYLPAVAHQGGYATLAGYWGLMEEERTIRDDGGRAGWWRLTPDGQLFVINGLAVPRYVRIYDGRVLGHEGERITIRDALGAKFDYGLLMAGAA